PDSADRLERLGRRAEPVELELRLALHEERLRPEALLVALRRGLRLRRGLFSVLALERGAGEVERRALGDRVVRELLAEPLPGRLLVLRASEPCRAPAGVVERL